MGLPKVKVGIIIVEFDSVSDSDDIPVTSLSALHTALSLVITLPHAAGFLK